MSARAGQQGRRYVELAYVTAVTALLLALVAERTRYGIEGLPSVLVFALPAGFGLEYVGASWRERWRTHADTRELPS